MLTPSEYDHLCDQIITIYDELDRAVINDMVRRMMKMGKVSDATSWQAKQLQESGLLYEDIISEISSHTDACNAQVRSLFEDAGVQSVRNDNRYYTAAGLEGIVKMSDTALQTLNAGYVKCRGDLRNLTLTTANATQDAYLRACDLAYMEVSSGAMDYGTAIRRAVQSAAEEGTRVLYPSGHSDRLDVAVRRSVLTGVGQTVRQLSAINANDMNCDIMEITAHSGARPSHAEWQGKLVSLSGLNAGRIIDGVKVLTTDEIGYGTGDGFGGWNCRHDWFPFIEGVSSRAYSDERLAELNAHNIKYDGRMYTEYEIDQMQRALERSIRDCKRKVSAADTAVKYAPDDKTAKQMQELFTAESVKLKKAEKELRTFLGQTGNLPDSTRVWVNGFGRSTVQRAVHANKKILQILDNNDIINLGNIMNGYKNYIQKYPTSNFNYYMVDYKVKQLGYKKGVALPAIPKNASVLADGGSKHDPYHIMNRMVERQITDDDLRAFMNNSKVMFAQWNGQRQAFYSSDGVVVITKSTGGWIYKTSFSKPDFDKETENILEVIRKYVK